MSKFKFIELFAGIGGFRQALDSLGGECVFASEIDKFATQSYGLLYGSDHLHGDITKIHEKEVPEHDILVAGTPCQSFSVAGKRLGFEDTRGTLFFDVARIAKEKKPKVVWIENVKGLVGHDRGKTLDTIVTTLNQIGYTVDFDVLNSKYFGVPQNRERIFIIALRDDLAKPAEWQIEGTNVVAKGKRRISQLDGVKTFNFDWPVQSTVATRLRNVLEPVVDERYYLSEEKTAKLVAQLKERDNKGEVIAVKGDLIDRENPRAQYGFDLEKMFTIRCAQVHAVAEPQVFGNLNHYGNDQMNRIYSAEGVSPTITVVSGGGREQKIAEPNSYRIRKLTPLECFRLQGFPDEAHEVLSANGISNSQLYKQAGNAVTVNVIDAIGRRLLPVIEEAN
jgi:DNA (cytosine-5)-methyltransferase 1